MNRNSPLIKDLLEIRQELIQKQEMQKDESKQIYLEEMFFIDLDLNYVMAPHKYVIQAIAIRFKYCLSNILRSRVD